MPDVPKLISVKETANLLSVSRATLYRIQKRDPRFPEPLHLSPGCVRWRADQISAYIKVLTPAEKCTEAD
ncbi:helix-turn-helix transcriptional regulator [Roseicyclus mahoneyensis]|jgi:prophage regulatory protein|uniref:AlpA family transcriptional regulator n=1 Tax=Roseicyclus mahoneyensis TaxID=164332 RepID=A0A316G4H6_9RHOB|nr:AlpA family phage regulatory protein [Roseicyclus mahoneyensis]PWK55593.1 AlpA family transcriptional regulator [Roseicyclus mahoneyensis]